MSVVVSLLKFLIKKKLVFEILLHLIKKKLKKFNVCAQKMNSVVSCEFLFSNDFFCHTGSLLVYYGCRYCVFMSCVCVLLEFLFNM